MLLGDTKRKQYFCGSSDINGRLGGLIGCHRTLKNPNVSDEAKQNAEEKLAEMGAK